MAVKEHVRKRTRQGGERIWFTKAPDSGLLSWSDIINNIPFHIVRVPVWTIIYTFIVDYETNYSVFLLKVFVD